MLTHCHRTGLAVVMPSLTQRRTLRIPTVVQLEALGLAPTIYEQDSTWPVGHDSLSRLARDILRTTLTSGATRILWVEDDIDVDPRLAEVLGSTGEPTVFFHGRSRHGAPATRMIGSQCVLLTREAAAALTNTPITSGRGIDIDMRAVVTQVHAPALVQHRALRRYASRGGALTADCYTGPDSHAILAALWRWLPGRRDRGRAITPSIAAATLAISNHEAQWGLEALLRMGCAIPDRSSMHRGQPLPWAASDDPDDAQAALC